MNGSGDTNPTPDDVLTRAKAALESEVWCWTGPQTPEIVRGLVAEIEQVRQWHSSQADKLERVLALAREMDDGTIAAKHYAGRLFQALAIHRADGLGEQ